MYAHKLYTQPQLLACLVLKRLFRTDDRGVEAILRDRPTLCIELGLKRGPHHTTLHRAQRWLIKLFNVRKLLFASVRCCWVGLRRSTGPRPTPPASSPRRSARTS